MLSSGISSRLQQLQNRGGSDDGTQNDLPRTCAEQPPSVGYGRQTVHPRASARRGLAADLINKFNQMATAPTSEQAATLGRNASRMHSSNSSIHKIFAHTTEPSPCKEACVFEQQQPSPAASIGSASPVGGCSTNDAADDDEGIVTAKSTVTGSGATVPPSDLSGVIVADATSSHLMSPVHPRVESLTEPCSGEARSSPFLSDSELNRALFEIQEFSRDMKILLDGGL